MVQIELTPEEIQFLSESCYYAKERYVEKSGKYLFDNDIPNYRQDIYLPKLKQFDEMNSKLRRLNK